MNTGDAIASASKYNSNIWTNSDNLSPLEPKGCRQKFICGKNLSICNNQGEGKVTDVVQF